MKSHHFAHLVSILGLVSLVGCGSSKEGKSLANNSSTGATNNSPAAECNWITPNSFGFDGAVSSFYDPAARAYNDSYSRLVFSALPVGVTGGDQQYIKIFRWHLNTATGLPVYSASAVGIVFAIRSSGQYLNFTLPMDTLSKATLSNLIATYGLAAQSITPDNFFAKTTMVLTGIQSSDQGLALSLYDASIGSAAQSTVEVLLPPFTANPTVYKSTHPYSRLYNLHPNLSLGVGFSDTQYVDNTNQYCGRFF